MGQRVLIIDDDSDLVASMSELLHLKGYQVIVAENGQQGFTTAVEQKPDVILLDVMMEDSEAGLDTAKQLRDREETAQIPVLLLTGIRKPEFLLDSFAPGEKFANVKQVLEKPLKPNILTEAISDSLKSS